LKRNQELTPSSQEQVIYVESYIHFRGIHVIDCVIFIQAAMLNMVTKVMDTIDTLIVSPDAIELVRTRVIISVTV
jgi:hypothetical protein